MRTTLDYYRIIAGWPPTGGSKEGMMNDICFLNMEQRTNLRNFLVAAVESGRVADPETALEILNRIRY